MDDGDLTRRSRLGSMLIVAAVVMPVLSLAGILVLRRFYLVHYDSKTLAMWLILDGIVLAAGLIARENAELPHVQQRRPRPRYRGRMR